MPNPKKRHALCVYLIHTDDTVNWVNKGVSQNPLYSSAQTKKLLSETYQSPSV